jgi:hypothetical protein
LIHCVEVCDVVIVDAELLQACRVDALARVMGKPLVTLSRARPCTVSLCDKPWKAGYLGVLTGALSNQ